MTPAHVLVDARGDFVFGEELELRLQLLGLGTSQRQQLEAVGGGQLGERSLRKAGSLEIGVERAVLQFFSALLLLEVLGPDVFLGETVGGENGLGIDERARARLVEGDALAFQVGDRLGAEPLLHDDMDALGIEVGDGAQLFHFGLALVDAGAGKGPEIDVRLAEARFHGAADDAIDVGHRAIGCDRADIDLVGRDGITDQTADRIVGAAGAARTDAKELLLGERSVAPRGKNPKRGSEHQSLSARDIRHCQSPSARVNEGILQPAAGQDYHAQMKWAERVLAIVEVSPGSSAHQSVVRRACPLSPESRHCTYQRGAASRCSKLEDQAGNGWV